MKIETLEQLKTVPAGTVLRLANGEDWHNAPNLVTLVLIGRFPADEVLPAVTLIPSVISQEQSDKATHQDLDLDRLEALANAATEGPWEADDRETLAEVIQRFEGCDSPDYLLADRLLKEGFRRLTVTPEMIEAVPSLIAEVRRLRADIDRVKAEAWAEGNLAAYPLQLAVGQFIDNGGDTWGNLDDAYEQASTATNPYQKEDDE